MLSFNDRFNKMSPLDNLNDPEINEIQESIRSEQKRQKKILMRNNSLSSNNFLQVPSSPTINSFPIQNIIQSPVQGNFYQNQSLINSPTTGFILQKPAQHIVRGVDSNYLIQQNMMLENQLKGQAEKINDLQRQKQLETYENNELLLRNEQTQHKIDELNLKYNQEYESASSLLNQLQDQFNKRTEEVRLLKNKYDSLVQTKQQLINLSQNNDDSYQNIVLNLQNQISKQLNENEQIKASINQIQNRTTQLSIQHQEDISILQQQIQDNTVCLKQYNQVQHNIQILESEQNATLQSQAMQINNLKAEVQKLMMENDILNASNTQVIEENKYLLSQIELHKNQLHHGPQFQHHPIYYEQYAIHDPYLYNQTIPNFNNVAIGGSVPSFGNNKRSSINGLRESNQFV